MLMNKVLKRASLLFLALSAVLWTVRLYVIERIERVERIEGCRDPAIMTAKDKINQKMGRIMEAVFMSWSVFYFISANANSDNISKWFHSQISSFSHNQLKIHSSCPAMNFSTHLLPMSGLHPLEYGTLSVIGEVQLPLDGDNMLSLQEQWLGNISELVQHTSAVLTSLSILVQNDYKRPKILSDLKSLGKTVIVSLANTVISDQVTDGESVRVISHMLEWAGIDWIGVYGKKHRVLRFGPGKGERVGVVAFCGVQKQCADTPNLAFSPIKYSLKLAKSAINDLNEHGVTVILVLMYWGLETSYFPDETALSIARQLAKLKVSAIIGYHPNSILHHAYYGNTLVIFSPGIILSSNRMSHFCWRKSQISGKWAYSSSKECEAIHPRSRDKLLHKEHKSRIYKLHLSRVHPVLAEYVTLELDDYNAGRGHFIRRPTATGHQEWIRVCSHLDTHCLSCNPF